MKIATLSGILSLIVLLAGFGWAASEKLSEKANVEDLQVVSAQVDYITDRQMESLVAQIAYLERKVGKTPGEIEHLRYLRAELERLRQVRQGK